MMVFGVSEEEGVKEAGFGLEGVRAAADVQQQLMDEERRREGEKEEGDAVTCR